VGEEELQVAAGASVAGGGGRIGCRRRQAHRVQAAADARQRRIWVREVEEVGLCAELGLHMGLQMGLFPFLPFHGHSSPFFLFF
jgi:hypothetical protein